MRKHKTVTIEQRVTTSIVCDACKKEYDSEDWMEAQEFCSVRIHGGYGSIFGDGSEYHADFCQHCAKNLFGKYLVEVSHE